MVHVYAINVTGLPDPKEYPEVMRNLPDKRKEKILRYLQVKDRKQSFGAGLLLHQVLLRNGFRMSDITYGPHGKPELDGIYFNLSHSHDYAVCVVGDKPVGCDVEKIDKIRERIAERFFTKKEVQYLDQLKGEEKDQEFFRLWTMKESYMKMTGEGMQLGLNRLEFRMDPVVQVYRDGEACPCYIKEYEIPGYKLTVCAEENDFSDMIEFV